MAHMDHAPQPKEKEDAGTVIRNARYGLILFAIYLACYGGFMFLSAFEPEIIAARPFGGINVATMYGFGLIVAALLLAFVYMYLCQYDVAGAGSRSPEGRE